MKNFSNLEFPIDSADCAEIEAIFIELIRAREAAAPALPFVDVPGSSPKPASEPGKL